MTVFLYAEAMRLFGLCKEMGYCLPSCSLCLKINADVERRLAEPKIIHPKRSRGRPPRMYNAQGKRYYQISISYYRTFEEVGVHVVQTVFMDTQEEY